MGMTDPIADMLTRIRNAIKASYTSVDMPNSKLKVNIAKVMKSEGFIKNFKVISDNKQGIMRIFFKYDENGGSLIEGIKRVSKPGRRIYAKSDKIPKVLNGFGINIISTSKGIIADNEARRQKVGGEILCSLW